jgi:hypothetical protein
MHGLAIFLQAFVAASIFFDFGAVDALKVKLAVAPPTRTPKTQTGTIFICKVCISRTKAPKNLCERLSVCFSARWIRIRRLGGPGPA